MSGQDEGQLKVRLGSLLNDIDPHPAPFDAVIRQGRGIKRRRLAAVASGLAVIAAGAVLGPTVLRSELTAPPVTPRPGPHYTVRVNPPAKGAKPGVIATGSINGWHWRATLSGTGDRVGVSFDSAIFPRLLFDQEFSAMPLRAPSLADRSKADFESSTDSSGTRAAYVAGVAPDVRSFAVELSNGQVLTLLPRAWAGHRYVAMVLPTALTVAGIRADGVNEEISYAVPFNFHGTISVPSWLRPGQSGPARATARIGAGGSGRSQWTATAYLGPWGLCGEVYEQGDWEGFCQPTGSPESIGLIHGEFGGGTPGSAEVAEARGDVAYLEVTEPDGSVVMLRTVRLPGYRYGLIAGIRPAHPAGMSWIAYDASSKRLGGGHGDPLGFR